MRVLMAHKSIILPRSKPYFQSSSPKSTCSFSFSRLPGAAAVVGLVYYWCRRCCSCCMLMLLLLFPFSMLSLLLPIEINPQAITDVSFHCRRACRLIHYIDVFLRVPPPACRNVLARDWRWHVVGCVGVWALT